MRAGSARTMGAFGALSIVLALLLTFAPAAAGPPEGVGGSEQAGPPESGPPATAPAQAGKEEQGSDQGPAPAGRGEKPGEAEEKKPKTPVLVPEAGPPAERGKASETAALSETEAPAPSPSVRQAPSETPRDAEPETLVAELHEPHRNTTVEDWVTGCTEGVVWHFVLNQLDPGTESLTLTAEFESAGTVTAQGRVVGNGSVQHFHVLTGVPETVITAWVQVTVTVVSATGPMLVISDVACAEEEPPPPPPPPEDVIDVSIVKTNDADRDTVFTEEETVVIEGADASLRSDVTFQAVVTNTGEVSVEIVSVVDGFGDTVLEVCASFVGLALAPGAKAICHFTVVDYRPVDGLTTVNTVEVLVRNRGIPDRTATDGDQSIVHFVRVLPGVVPPAPPPSVAPPMTVPTAILPETLPFTGLDLLRMVLLATGLLAGGWALARPGTRPSRGCPG